VQSNCESSTGSSSSTAAHPSPVMSTRGRELSLHLRQQRLQLLSSSDGDFNYITAANAAKAANRMVCNTVSSTLNSESVLVLYRGGPI
jgi:ribosomal protein L33